MTETIVNLHKINNVAEYIRLPNVVYIGRKHESIPDDVNTDFGNPFNHDGSCTREGREICKQKYREYIEDKPHLKARIKDLSGQTLACWCTPEPCHAEILLQLMHENSPKGTTGSAETEMSLDADETNGNPGIKNTYVEVDTTFCNGPYPMTPNRTETSQMSCTQSIDLLLRTKQ